MALEIRAIKNEEKNAFKRLARRSLLLPPHIAAAAVEGISEDRTLCAFENGQMATTYGWWPLNMRINCAHCPAAGITFVSTSPVHRRRGYLRQITARHFEMLHETGERPIAALHASVAGIYHRYGYAVVSSQQAYSFAPRHLNFVRPPEKNPAEAGRLREIGDDDRAILKDMYQRFCRERTGYLHRGKATWEAGVLAPPPENGERVQIVYEEAGTPLGYVIYTASPAKAENGRLRQQIDIRELVWLNARACLNLWQYFASMDLADVIRCSRMPADDPLPHLLSDPRELNITSRDGVMARLVDVREAMGRRGYDSDGAICFELEDPLCEWNRGKWEFEAADGKTETQPGRRRPDLRLPVDTLAMIFFGRISASQAAAMGRLDVYKPGALPVWDRLFQTRHRPFCPDFF